MFIGSDPPIPAQDKCLNCRKTAAESGKEKLARCGGCRMAYFCDRKCQAAAWKGKYLSTAPHKDACGALAKRNQPNMLPYKVRVIRSAGGAHIENPEAIPVARLPTTREERKQIPSSLEEDGCARAHYLSVLRHLTKAQLEQNYPLACIERWGQRKIGSRDVHQDGQLAKDDGPIDVAPLKRYLNGVDYTMYEGCTGCGADGRAWFSFCLNRAVNSNMVHHCEFCQRCFYHQPGFLRGCQYCGKGHFFIRDDDYDDETDTANPVPLARAAGVSIEEARAILDDESNYLDSWNVTITFCEEYRGSNVPEHASWESRGLAREGFWGW